MLATSHIVSLGDARRLAHLPDESVALVVTSPPYPMIEMWDEAFGGLSTEVRAALDAEDGDRAFEACHQELDRTWRECLRVLIPGGLACINIGDATRTLRGAFRIYPNHARVLLGARGMGFSALPDIVWRKQTNAPNKFMGSGMLPAGAYVTYEHEYVLILRKGDRRRFPAPAAKELRRRSAYFWEERNVWFSDVWTDLKGTSQSLADPAARQRSAAYPFELAYRLVQMYSVQGDVVLDPFAGTGTTGAAALAAGRSSALVELDQALLPTIRKTLSAAVALGAARAAERLERHRAFIAARREAGKPPKHVNEPYGFPVVTSQERHLVLPSPTGLAQIGADRFVATYLRAELPTVPRQRSLFVPG